MEAITLSNFIKENNVEYHWHDDDVIIMPYTFQLESFTKLFDSGLFDNNIECIIRDGYLEDILIICILLK